MSRTVWMIFASVGLVGSARADVSEPTIDLPPPPPPVLRVSKLPPSLTPAMDIAPLEDPPNTVTTSYRAITMSVDVAAVAAAFGGYALLDKRNDTPGNNFAGGLMVVGVLTGAYAVPIIHAARGHKMRAFTSWLLRDGAMGFGGMVGLVTAQCSSLELFCGLDRIGPGMAGGLVVASLIDAALLTDEKEQRPPTGTTWSPLLAPSRCGGTVGLAAAF
jgi:hypothetical protein